MNYESTTDYEVRYYYHTCNSTCDSTYYDTASGNYYRFTYSGEKEKKEEFIEEEEFSV